MRGVLGGIWVVVIIWMMVSPVYAQHGKHRGRPPLIAERLEQRQRIEVLLKQARRHLVMGEEGLAAPLINDAIGIDPTRAETYFALGEMYQDIEQHSPERWLGYYERYVALATDRRAPSWFRTHMLLGQEALQRAALLDDAGEPSRDVLLVAERHYLLAYDSLLRIRSLDRWSRDRVELRLILVNGILGRFDVAERYLNELQQRSGIHWQGLSADEAIDRVGLEMRILSAQGRAEEALEVYERLTNHPAMYGNVYLNLLLTTRMHCLLQAERWGEALETLQAFDHEMKHGQFGARSRKELSLMSLNNWANYYLARHQYGHATEKFRRIHEMEANATAKNNLAWGIALSSELGAPELEEALRLSREAVADSRNYANLDTLAEVYLRMHRHEDALKTIERAIWIRPHSEYLRQQRARILGAQRGAIIPVDGAWVRKKRWRVDIKRVESLW